ncbi:hypothetical protein CAUPRSCDRAFT_11648 [Caulochytrium protostelioides]|uniref:Uncharacterized protein n=1 Tax=Caulochytrium protostelioides TaxID=1555241 RepID=A0A4P9WTX0_9FUNG|nr:hypothetical protein CAUPRSCDRAFT_11648 [Caulochytrium protostelioides]
MLMFIRGHEGLLPFVLQALLSLAVTALPPQIPLESPQSEGANENDEFRGIMTTLMTHDFQFPHGPRPAALNTEDPFGYWGDLSTAVPPTYIAGTTELDPMAGTVSLYQMPTSGSQASGPGQPTADDGFMGAGLTSEGNLLPNHQSISHPYQGGWYPRTGFDNQFQNLLPETAIGLGGETIPQLSPSFLAAPVLPDMNSVIHGLGSASDTWGYAHFPVDDSVQTRVSTQSTDNWMAGLDEGRMEPGNPQRFGSLNDGPHSLTAGDGLIGPDFVPVPNPEFTPAMYTGSFSAQVPSGQLRDDIGSLGDPYRYSQDPSGYWGDPFTAVPPQMYPTFNAGNGLGYNPNSGSENLLFTADPPDMVPANVHNRGLDVKLLQPKPFYISRSSSIHSAPTRPPRKRKRMTAPAVASEEPLVLEEKTKKYWKLLPTDGTGLSQLGIHFELSIRSLVEKLDQGVTDEAFLNDLFKLPNAPHKENFQYPDLIGFNAAVLRCIADSSSPDLPEGSEGSEGHHDILLSTAEYIKRMQKVLIAWWNVHQCDRRKLELTWDTIATFIYFQHLIERGRDYRPNFPSATNIKQHAPSEKKPQPKVTNNEPTKANRSHRGVQWEQKTDSRKNHMFKKLEAWVSECKEYLVDVFEIEPTEHHTLPGLIREYVEKRKQNTEAARLSSLFTKNTSTSEFEEGAKDVAFTALKRRREAFDLTTTHLRDQLEFSRNLHPSSAFAHLKSPRQVLSLLEEERRTNVDLFRAAVSSFNELVSIFPFSGVGVPLKKIENPSDALKDLQLINSPLTDLIPEAPSALHAANKVRPPIHIFTLQKSRV